MCVKSGRRKKKSSRWYKKVFSIVYQKHRDDFPKTSKWFTEDIEMIFFSLSSNLYFLDESRMKDEVKGKFQR
jgi:hypothetical protein